SMASTPLLGALAASRIAAWCSGSVTWYIVASGSQMGLVRYIRSIILGLERAGLSGLDLRPPLGPGADQFIDPGVQIRVLLRSGIHRQVVLGVVRSRTVRIEWRVVDVAIDPRRVDLSVRGHERIALSVRIEERSHQHAPIL